MSIVDKESGDYKTADRFAPSNSTYADKCINFEEDPKAEKCKKEKPSDTQDELFGIPDPSENIQVSMKSAIYNGSKLRDFKFDVLLIYDPDTDFYYAQDVMKFIEPKRLKVLDFARDQPPGMSQREFLTRALADCKYTCLVVTRGFINTMWLKFKADMAIQDMLHNEEKQYSLVVVVMDAALKQQHLPLDLQTLSPIYRSQRYFETRMSRAFQESPFTIQPPSLPAPSHGYASHSHGYASLPTCPAPSVGGGGGQFVNESFHFSHDSVNTSSHESPHHLSQDVSCQQSLQSFQTASSQLSHETFHTSRDAQSYSPASGASTSSHDTTHSLSSSHYPTQSIASSAPLLSHDSAPSRESTSSYSPSRESIQSYLRSRESAPSYPSSRDSAPSYQPSRESAPSYPSSRDSAPSYQPSRESASSYQPSRDSAPSYPSSRDSAPSYQPSRDSAPSYQPSQDTFQPVPVTSNSYKPSCESFHASRDLYYASRLSPDPSSGTHSYSDSETAKSPKVAMTNKRMEREQRASSETSIASRTPQEHTDTPPSSMEPSADLMRLVSVTRTSTGRRQPTEADDSSIAASLPERRPSHPQQQAADVGQGKVPVGGVGSLESIEVEISEEELPLPTSAKREDSTNQIEDRWDSSAKSFIARIRSRFK